MMQVKGDVEAGAEGLDEVLIGVGFRAAQAVVDVDGGETYSEGVVFCLVGGVKCKEEGHGVCSAGDGGAEAVAGANMFAGEG